MEYIFLLGRVLFGGYFVLSGIRHFRKTNYLAQYAASKGLPAPKVGVVVSGLMMFLGGLGIVLGMYIMWSVAFIAAFLIVSAFTIHAFWKLSDPAAKASEEIQFSKNIALAGAALMFLSIPLGLWTL